MSFEDLAIKVQDDLENDATPQLPARAAQKVRDMLAFGGYPCHLRVEDGRVYRVVKGWQ